MSASAPTTKHLFRVFGRIGLLSFGGPAAQIALMHRELVEDRPWLSEAEFLRALSFCMLLPGPEAMQLATYAGWKLRGTFGGLLAGLLFVVPGAVVILLLALAYVAWGDIPLAKTLFLGIKATVVVIVVQALWRLSRKALAGPAARGVAVLSFVAIFFLGLPFPLIIGAAALWGALTASGTAAPRDHPPSAPPIRASLIWIAVWLIPVGALWLWGPDILSAIALFFSKLAVVTFGGAYAVLAYMTQEVVTTEGWLNTGQMLDALGLAETTPGPLILVTQFAGFLAGHGNGGVWMGIAAALVTLWVTFVPCFLWIFAGAPYIDRLAAAPRLSGALSAVTAAVVGVIANLSLWFALHVLFGQLNVHEFGPAQIITPQLSSLSPLAVSLAILAAGLLIGLRWSLPLVLVLMALAAPLFQALI